MFWWSYTRTTFRGGFSILPLLAMLFIGLVLYKNAHAIEGFVITLLEWVGIALGISIALTIGLAVYFRATRLRVHRPIRPLNTTQDIPILGYTLNPEPVAEIEPVKETLINGVPISQYKMNINRSYGKKA